MLINLARRDDRETRAFTLVELAGVILVIAILAAIAIPVFQLFQTRSRGAAMDTTGDNFNNSLIALSQQAGRSANDGRDLIGAYLELPQVTRDVVAVIGYGDEAPAGGDDILDPDNDYAVLALFQQFGDNVRAGCLFLPSEEAAGEAPVYVRHGTTYEGADVDWDDDGTDELSDGDEIDATTDGCISATPAAEDEGVFNEDTAGAGPPVQTGSADMDADGTDDVDFNDSQSYDDSMTE